MRPAKSSSRGAAAAPRASGQADCPPYLVAEAGAPGRPAEIELASNRRLIHPLSSRLVDILAPTPVTPNQVSIAGLAAAVAAAACLIALANPWRALAAFACLFAWHVLDGADGALARRTGRSSPVGELIDGVCDHAAQILVYVALAAVLARRIGVAAWPLATLSGACHFVQANAYESWRKSYRHFGYGAAWMDQTFRGVRQPGAGWAGRVVAGIYLALSGVFLANQAAVGEAVRQGGTTARERYREAYAPLVRRAAWLSSNTRTIALCAAVLLGAAIGYFIFEIVILDVALAALVLGRRRVDRRFLASQGSNAFS